MAFLYEEEDNHSYKDEKKERARWTDTHQNLKRRISLVSSQLCQSLVAMLCTI